MSALSWLSDLASGLGLPAGVVLLASGLYGACSAAEKIASPTAKADISRALKSPEWGRVWQPSALVNQAFDATFGARHLSWVCFRRSVAATFLVSFSIFIAGLMEGETYSASVGYGPLRLALGFLIYAVLPDYLSLAKTRYLLSFYQRRTDWPFSLLWLIDIAFAVMISLSMPTLVALFYLPFSKASMVPNALFDLTTNNYQHGRLQLFGIYFISTLFTSGWMGLIFLSASCLKLLLPIRRFTAWFLDTDKHPLQALGIVSGGLIMLVAAALSLIRAAL